MKRTNARIMAMIVLYNYDITKEINIKSLEEMIGSDFNYDEEFATTLVAGVLDNLQDIDYLISINLENYTIERLSYVDRNLIRIGVYEMLKTETPINIIINEIVEISKIFSEIDDFPSSKFNNSILDKIAKGLKNGK
ncbi:MAG TPA: transcription antitermination factor NusB [Bacilli bacterium]